MFNNTQYDLFISIRQIFLNIKIDIIWINLIAWFFIIYKKLKRLYIRIFKKKNSKLIIKIISISQTSQFKFQFIFI